MLTFRHLMVSTALSIVSGLFLTGCSFFADFFVLNTTDKKVTAIIKFNKPIDEYLKDSFSIQLSYADSIFNINDKTQGQLNNKLNYTALDHMKILVDLPAKSTILIGGSINRPLSADSITIIRNKVITNYAMDDIYKKTKKTGGLFPPFHITYRIE